MLVLIGAYAADLIFGDPEWMPHPVRWIGSLINFLDTVLRGNSPARVERLKGAVAAIIVILISVLSAYVCIEGARRINPILGYIVWVYVAYTTLATRDLCDKASAVLSALRKGSLNDARRELSKIVSRKTSSLDEEKVVISTVESIAENTSDGVIAPLFYLILGGPVMAIAYKSINTLDSMIGYKNEKYIYFGWFSARLDDVANFIPARISGLLVTAAAAISGGGFQAAFKTMRRDGRKHASPNSGVPEAAMAGALGVRFGGTWEYDGKEADKPYIGEQVRPVKASMIGEAMRLSVIASLLMVTIGTLYRWLV